MKYDLLEIHHLAWNEYQAKNYYDFYSTTTDFQLFFGSFSFRNQARNHKFPIKDENCMLLLWISYLHNSPSYSSLKSTIHSTPIVANTIYYSEGLHNIEILLDCGAWRKLENRNSVNPDTVHTCRTDDRTDSPSKFLGVCYTLNGIGNDDDRESKYN